MGAPVVAVAIVCVDACTFLLHQSLCSFFICLLLGSLWRRRRWPIGRRNQLCLSSLFLCSAWAPLYGNMKGQVAVMNEARLCFIFTK